MPRLSDSVELERDAEKYMRSSGDIPLSLLIERRSQISGRPTLKSSGSRAVVETDFYDFSFDLGTDRLIFCDHRTVSQGGLAPEPIKCRAGIVIGLTEASERTAVRRQKLQLPAKRW